MARLGTKSNPTKQDYVNRPEIPVNKKYTAEEWNYLSDKCQNPGIDQAFSAAIRADDFYTQADFTQSGALAFTKHGSVTSEGKGNGAMGKFTCDGSAVSFSVDFEVNYPATFDNLSEYIYFFVWNGTKFQGFVRLVGADAGGGGTTPTLVDQDLTPNTTSGDGQDSGLTISGAIAAFSGLFVNGQFQTVGDGVKTKDAYFSNDAGVTARAISAIATGDALYWNGVIAGFDLINTFSIAIKYEV